MKIKAIDIARELGISKSSVSLALNGKPGVSAQTRKDVFECKKRLEECNLHSLQHTIVNKKGYTIQVVVVSNTLNENYNGELDLWTNVLSVFGRIAQQNGYSLGITYFDKRTDNIVELIKSCNAEAISGIILFGSELNSEDKKWLSEIVKPIVIYDNDLDSNLYTSVLVNNYDGIRMSVDYLYQRGIRDIQYLSGTESLYNYTIRRKAFRQEMRSYRLEYADDRIIPIGNNIEQVYYNLLKYLANHTLPEAYIMESYHQSVGAIRAFRQANIHIPEDVSLIGIDELPSYLTGDCTLTTIRIPHTDRARLVMTLLFQEIECPSTFKSKVYTNCMLVEGTSVRLLHNS